MTNQQHTVMRVYREFPLPIRWWCYGISVTTACKQWLLCNHFLAAPVSSMRTLPGAARFIIIGQLSSPLAVPVCVSQRSHLTFYQRAQIFTHRKNEYWCSGYYTGFFFKVLNNLFTGYDFFMSFYSSKQRIKILALVCSGDFSGGWGVCGGGLQVVYLFIVGSKQPLFTNLYVYI